MDIDLSGLDLTARGYAGGSDHSRMAELTNRWNEAVGLEERTSTEEIGNNYRHLKNCDPARDMVMVTDGDELAGYTRTTWWPVEDVRKWAVFCRVDPEYRSTGLVERLLRASVDHTLDRIGGEADSVLQGWAEREREPEHSAAYQDLGFHVETYGAMMTRPHLDDIPDFQLPDGLETKPVTDDQIRQIWEADDEAFKDHWDYSPQTEEDWLQFLEFPHLDTSLWKIAWDGDEVAGQVKSFISESENAAIGRNRGWTEFISTGRRWRRMGVAKALIAASLRELRDRGMEEAALGVHVDNPNGAFTLYESLGYRVDHMYLTYERKA